MVGKATCRLIRRLAPCGRRLEENWPMATGMQTPQKCTWIYVQVARVPGSIFLSSS
jgi:hypothetical protein